MLKIQVNSLNGIVTFVPTVFALKHSKAEKGQSFASLASDFKVNDTQVQKDDSMVLLTIELLVEELSAFLSNANPGPINPRKTWIIFIDRSYNKSIEVRFPNH